MNKLSYSFQSFFEMLTMTTKWSKGCSWLGMYFIYLELKLLIVTTLGFRRGTVEIIESLHWNICSSDLFTWGCTHVLFFIVVVISGRFGKMNNEGSKSGDKYEFMSPPTISFKFLNF